MKRLKKRSTMTLINDDIIAKDGLKSYKKGSRTKTVLGEKVNG
jgi:hypothetical protein